MTAPGYIDVIFDICKKEQITGVLSLIDPELSLLAKHQKDFEALGVTVIGSSYELCERTLNKWEMYCWMAEHGYPCAKSYIDLESFFADVDAGKVTYPVFVKPAKGSASMQISKAYDKEMDHLSKEADREMSAEFDDDLMSALENEVVGSLAGSESVKTTEASSEQQAIDAGLNRLRKLASDK